MTKDAPRPSDGVSYWQDKCADLEAENMRLRGVLEDGCDLGLAPDECVEALSKCKVRPE